MLLPSLCPGIEQCDPLTRYSIFPVNMRPFMGVAMRARQRHVRHLRLATPRPRQNMVDLKATALELGRQLTVFAAVPPAFSSRRSARAGQRSSITLPASLVCYSHRLPLPPEMSQVLPACPRRRSRGRRPRVSLWRSPPPACDACPAPVALHRAPPGCEGRGKRHGRGVGAGGSGGVPVRGLAREVVCIS